MVESKEEYVLQWDAHAKYVTERFSGLFARQALVDVTLICDEQKLRVHKLVLASCSLYFEEMLQQDLGQEPVIFLDLNFEILKAMVEFMYCGETTISQQSLPSLLEAAENFKVKELAFMIEKTIRPQDDSTDSLLINDQELIEQDVQGVGCTNKLLDNVIEVNFSETENNNSKHSSLNTNDVVDSNCNINTVSNNESEHSFEPTLYEDINNTTKSKLNILKNLPTISEANATTTNNNNLNSNNNLVLEDSMKRLPKFGTNMQIDNGNYEMLESNPLEHKENNDLMAMSYEHCCDIMNNTCTNLQYSTEYEDFTDNRVGQCLRVYTHKRRKGKDKLKGGANHVKSLIPEPLPTTCIDLLDESSSEDTPVTLQTSLNTECLEYMLSLHDGTISSITTIIDRTSNVSNDSSDDDNDVFIRHKSLLLKEKTSESNSNSDSNVSSSSTEQRKMKELFSDDLSLVRSSSTLRRSVRLSQQDNDNFGMMKRKLHERSGNKRKCNKDLEHRVPDINSLNVTSQTALRKSSKRQGQNVKGKRRYEKFGKIHTPTTDASLSPMKHVDTAATSIDRALWGDMSDVIEYKETSDLRERYEENAEIPFAVGLLPLRAALERMQAMPEHQPRKTRSSVAPGKHESTGLRRKHNVPRAMDCATTNINKKQSDEIDTTEENSNAVCHIQIRTSSQYSRSRKASLKMNDVNSVQTASVANK